MARTTQTEADQLHTTMTSLVDLLSEADPGELAQIKRGGGAKPSMWRDVLEAFIASGNATMKLTLPEKADEENGKPSYGAAISGLNNVLGNKETRKADGRGHIRVQGNKATGDVYIVDTEKLAEASA